MVLFQTKLSNFWWGKKLGQKMLFPYLLFHTSLIKVTVLKGISLSKSSNNSLQKAPLTKSWHSNFAAIFGKFLSVQFYFVGQKQHCSEKRSFLVLIEPWRVKWVFTMLRRRHDRILNRNEMLSPRFSLSVLKF